MMEYNTKQKKLPLPEYGRSVQKMVDHALTITDREERQQCAETIVHIMGSMFPNLPNQERKLWDHLAIMSDFQLDIDYPCEIVRKESLETLPERIPYNNSNIKLRHYGKFTEDMLKKAQEMPEGEVRNALVDMLANYMKRSYITWNKDNVEDEKIWQDIRDYTHGTIHIDTPLMRAKDIREGNQQQGKENNNNNKKKKKK
jgi:hypothetical protein